MASRAMQTQMTGVEVSGQNLANVNTKGYSRQQVNITTSPDLVTSIGDEGTGADATSITQLVSNLLNSQIQSQGSTSGYWTAQQTALQGAQDSLNEYLNGSSTSSTSATSTSSTDTNGTGLSSQLNSFFAAFSALASAGSDSNKQAAVSAGQNLATTFNNISSQFSGLRSSLNSSLTGDVTSANKLLTDIASLNGEISTTTAGGGNANDLLDEREQDLENLSQLTNITTSSGTNGTVNVTIGGQSLVTGNSLNDTLQTYDAGSGNLLVQTASGTSLTLTGGSMQGTIDARDGTLTSMQTSINTLANTLINQVNTIHDSGYNSTGGTGNSFFTGTDASTIGVNSTLANNASLVQISSSASASGDTSLALQIANLASSSQAALNNGTFTQDYNTTVAGLGNALSTANTQVTDQTAVSNMLSTQRSSVSGVNVDEEMTNLMSYQRAYQASAQVVTTVNSMMGDVLGMTGTTA
jgi:flagellar hook-associated protein 1 FlgK